MSSSVDRTDMDSDVVLASQLTYRQPCRDDIPRCFEIESASYPSDEAASWESLILRQEQAGEYFLICTIPSVSGSPNKDDDDDTIVGFVCATRCNEFTEESMSSHDPMGRLLAIHSVVVDEPYRNRGIAKAMLRHYVNRIQQEQQQQYHSPRGVSSSSSSSSLEEVPPIIESMVLLSKKHLLGFYVQCGFFVNRPSPIVHGQELWYELEQSCIRSSPKEGEMWFCKTEQFKKPYPDVRPYLEEHKTWVQQLRASGHCITSGYRVDGEGKPGGGGLMFLTATSYDEAMNLVLQDPLVANDCVNWELNGWIGQVGDIQMR
ncbi:YCII-related protein [Nitzschia inconspicua]|uniref:YCII-related protein n=1 Tax=Nitzschia inconspicua TaxID=303405 RepID=A0A9K3LJ78_9STRA|nr:YCII-related protein [Nitzschia inconspicua]